MRVVRIFWLFLCIQVVQVAEKLIKSVVCRKKLVLIAQVVLTKLRSDIALVLEERRQGDVLGPNTEVSPGRANFRQSCANR